MSLRFHRIYERVLVKVEAAVGAVRAATNDVTRKDDQPMLDEELAAIKAFGSQTSISVRC